MHPIHRFYCHSLLKFPVLAFERHRKISRRGLPVTVDQLQIWLVLSLYERWRLVMCNFSCFAS